jgi:hypothetical protein
MLHPDKDYDALRAQPSALSEERLIEMWNEINIIYYQQ